MTDTKIPQPALFSETLEKARRNTLVWSALAIAAELAQSKDHTLKSSILGGETGLPVAMVAFLFITLSAFHFVAFWFEKKRIERWRSRYASEHEGRDLNERITALFSRLENLFVDIDQSYANSLSKFDSLGTHITNLAMNYAEMENHILSLRKRHDKLNEDFMRGSIPLENLRDAFLPLRESYNYNLAHGVTHSTVIKEMDLLRSTIETQPGLSGNYHKLLVDMAEKLGKLSADISASEQTYFRWYEVAMPIAALICAISIWFIATIFPDFPIAIRAAFYRS